MNISGNRPPASLPLKAQYVHHDVRRSAQHFGLPPIVTPSNFPALTVVPQRLLLAVQQQQEQQKSSDDSRLTNLSRQLWLSYWTKDEDISTEEVMKECCRRIGFSDEEIKSLWEAIKSDSIKKRLIKETEDVVARGAFGAPSIFLKTKDGNEEYFFGSDRFDQIFPMIGIEYTGPFPEHKAKL